MSSSLPSAVSHESQTSKEPVIFLKNWVKGSMQDLKGLEEGTILKLTLLPKPTDQRFIELVAVFGSIYTCESHPEHSDCCIMFEIIENGHLLAGYQFRHLNDLQSIQVLDRVEVKAEAIGNLYRERNNLRRRLDQIEKIVQTLTKLLTQ